MMGATLRLTCRGSATCLGLGRGGYGGQLGRTQNFLAEGLRQGPKPTYPENFVSPRISSTLFWNIEKSKIKKWRKKTKWRRVTPGSPDTFPFIALVGEDIGRNLMIATNNIANISFLSWRTVWRWKYDSLIRDPDPLFLSDTSQILFNPHLATSF